MQPNSQAALAQLQQTQAQSQDPNTILSGQRQQLGVNAAQDTVTGLRGAINNTTNLLKQVAPSIMGRTANSLVTNAQATGQIANAQRPIAQNLSEQGTQYSEAEGNLNRLNQRAQEAASGIYAGQQDKLSYAQNLYNTLYQKERDAQAQADAERDRLESIRQFNAQLAKSGGGNRTFDLGMSQPVARPPLDSIFGPAPKGGTNSIPLKVTASSGFKTPLSVAKPKAQPKLSVSKSKAQPALRVR